MYKLRPNGIRPPNQKSWIHPWAHPPSENPGYGDVISRTPSHLGEAKYCDEYVCLSVCLYLRSHIRKLYSVELYQIFIGLHVA